jgi:hypothetical protein
MVSLSQNNQHQIKGALKIMAWTKAKTAIVASAAVILVATTAVVRIKLERAHWTNRYLSISAGAADTAKTADEAARVFLEAMSKGDKDTIAQFLGWGAPSIDQLLTDKNKSTVAGLEIVSFGTPTNIAGTIIWFVPYEIRFKNGDVHTNRLRFEHDPRTKRWYWNGGL